MAILEDLHVCRAPAAGLAAVGLFWGSFAAWLPEIKLRAGVSDAGFGGLMILSALGGMVAMSMAPRWRARFGPGLLPKSGVLVAAVALVPALVGGPVQLALALLMIGMAMSLCDILSNIRISDIEAHEGRPLMNLNHAIFSFCLGLSAALMGVLRGAGISHFGATLLVAVAILGLCLLMRPRRLPRGRSGAEADAPAGLPAPWIVVLPGAMMLMLCFMAENSAEAWGAIHIERSLGMANGFGAFGPAMFGFAMGLARLGGQGLVRRMGEVRLIALSVIVAALGALALATAPGLTVALLGAGALGLGLAVVVPSANSLIARTVPQTHRASAISRAWTVGFSGFFVGPPLIGLISQTVGLRVAFALIAVMIVAILPCLQLLARRQRAMFAISSPSL